MPRKKNCLLVDKPDKVKKNIINTLIKSNTNDEENIILQLQLSQTKINNILSNNNLEEPKPYESSSYFNNNLGENISNSNNIIINNTSDNDEKYNKKEINCFWCCHSINKNIFNMPYNYDNVNDIFIVYGSFCSLQCANAYNFSINSGSDKVWEINGMIQMMAKLYGFKNIIRPAPSKYLLNFFNGPLTIEEFRNAHIDYDKTYVLNIPPLITVSNNIECINTSYLVKQNQDKNIQNKKSIDNKLKILIK